METTVAIWDERYGVPKYAGQIMTKTDFLRWESDDNYVYEFVDGILGPITGMKQNEVILVNALENHFFKTTAFEKGG